jgi:parallel beta-helix repeat protein
VDGTILERNHVWNPRLAFAFSLILAAFLLPVCADKAVLLPQAMPQTHAANESASVAYTPHSPIFIDDDDGFDDDWPGDGTKDNPFIIEGFHIKSNVYCIKIVSTSSHFIIRDCLLENRDDVIDGNGIVMERVRNGVVERCIINGMSTGINILKSEQVSILSCEITKGKGGIRLEKILTSEVGGCELSDFDYGIYASRVSYSRLTENRIEITTNGIIVDNCVRTNITENTIQNADQGLSLYSSEMLNASSNVINDVRTGVFLKFTHSSSVVKNDVRDGGYGIFLESSDGNEVASNLVTDTRSTAVYVIYSWNNIFTGNEITDNAGVGVYLYDSADCVLYANYIGYNLMGNAFDYVGPASKSLSNSWDDGNGEGNVWGGIWAFTPFSITGDRGSMDHYPIPILTTGNPLDFTVEAGSLFTITWNASAARPHYYTVKQNDIVIEENLWDGKSIDVVITSLDPGVYKFTIIVNSTSGRDTQSTIEVTSIDTTSPEWIEPPVNKVIEHGNRLLMKIEASDLFGISNYWINDTGNFKIDANGALEDVHLLVLGTYYIEIRAYDPSLNYISEEIVITVQDTVAPGIVGPGDITYTEGETGNTISWIISDGNPSLYQVYLNGELVAESAWTEYERTLDITVDDLSPGTHVYRLDLYDQAGNSASDEVTVIVNAKTTETTTDTTPTLTTETTSTSSPTSTPTPTEPTPVNGTMLITGIAGLAVFGVVAIILMMRKRK